ncbi:hypothetical protein CCHR01_09323, partial [Colletotrichum chrysophilum]
METHPGPAMGHRSLLRRASKSCLGGFKKVFSTGSDRHDDFLAISKASTKSFKFSFKTTSLWKRTAPEEDEKTCKPKPNNTDTTPEESRRIKDPELRRQAYPQGQSHLFRRLPPEIREQIYKEFWVACGVERHAFLEDGNMRYSPCVTDHEAPDERQLGLARDFRKAPQVQWHPEWFLRMQSPWCNHWRCEELWEDIKEGRKVDLNAGQNQAFMSLLVSCKRVYDESIDSFRESRILNITNGHTLQRLLKYPRPRYVSAARTINISLREDSGNWLYLNGGSIWRTLAAKETKATKVYVWLDAECPLTRRLLTEFRELYTGIPAEIAPKLTIDFPCDAEDGLCPAIS